VGVERVTNFLACRVDGSWKALIGTLPVPRVNQVPNAVISTPSISDLTVKVDGAASFDVDGTIAKWAWDFGDGSTAAGATQTHTYGKGGQYLLSLTVTDNDGATATSSRRVTVTAPITDQFVLGTTKPVGTSVSTKGNAGTGVVRPAPTGTGGTLTGAQTVAAGKTLTGKTINGDVTVQSGGQLLDCIVNGRVFLTGTGALVENNDIRGNGTNYDSSAPGTALVICKVSSGTRNSVRFNRIHNQVATRAMNGIFFETLDVYRNEIFDVVDGIDCNDGLADANMQVRGNHLHDFVSYKPDFNRDRTHNDGIQSQGGPLLVEGNNLEMTWSAKSTQPIDSSYVQLAAFMGNHSKATQKATLKNNWLSGGQVLVNFLDTTTTGGGYAGMGLTVTGNRFDLTSTGAKSFGHCQITKLAQPTLQLAWSGNVNQSGAPIAAPLYV
jgi:PKD repeat protein